jgi:hypothetical protein
MDPGCYAIDSVDRAGLFAVSVAEFMKSADTDLQGCRTA